MTYSNLLQCEWTTMRAIGDTRLEIYMPQGNCPDMNGCIALAQFVMPLVEEIRTYSDGKRDTFYCREMHTGKWGSWPGFRNHRKRHVDVTPGKAADSDA